MNGREPNPKELVTEILEKIARLNRQLPAADAPSRPATSIQGAPVSDPADSKPANSQTQTPIPASENEGAEFGVRLQQQMLDMGILPAFTTHVLEHLQSTECESQPESEVLPYVRALLRSWWRPVQEAADFHVFVGPAGAGKTTVLSKWLAQEVLLGARPAHVWRLDGCTANTAEALTVYSEILGVPVTRAWNHDLRPMGLQFFDLPGVDWRDAGAVAGLSKRIQELGAPQVHLVLNAAYDTPLLLHQARVFSKCSVSDLILTHLDEETRWGKLWNLVAGTELPIRFLSAGQNVPGHFRVATPELLLPTMTR